MPSTSAANLRGSGLACGSVRGQGLCDVARCWQPHSSTSLGSLTTCARAFPPASTMSHRSTRQQEGKDLRLRGGCRTLAAAGADCGAAEGLLAGRPGSTGGVNKDAGGVGPAKTGVGLA